MTYGPHTLKGIWEPINGVPHMYNMIWMFEPCNIQRPYDPW